MALDNLRGGTKRVVEESTPLNNLRGGTKRVVIVDGGGGGSVDYAKTVQRAETMPTADASNAGQQFLYSGESDATYTHGYIYECVTDDNTTWYWKQLDVQPSSGGGLVNETTGQNSLSILGANRPSSSNMVAIGKYAGSNAASHTTLIGYSATSRSNYGIAIGSGAGVGVSANYAIQIGAGANSDANTFKVANENGNFELMSADGTVPTARLTKVNTTATLAVADWSSNTQTVTVSGIKADSVVFVSPAPASASDYASAGILCTAQAADSLTFTCITTPTNAITVNVVCM